MEEIQTEKKGFLTKKVTIIIAAVALVVIVGGGIGVYFAFFSDKWVAKVNGEKITLTQFNNQYYALNRRNFDMTNEDINKLSNDSNEVAQNPSLNKSDFLNQMVDQLVVYQVAKDAGYTKKPELLILDDYQLQTLVSKYYIISALKDKIRATDQEVADAYAKNKAQFGGAPLQMVEQRIRTYISDQKLQVEQNKKLQELRENAQIDRNEDIINKLMDPDKTKQPKKGNIVTIKGKNITTKSISVEEFLKSYYLQFKVNYTMDEATVDKLANDPAAMEQNPLFNKKLFLDQIIGQYLFYEEARNAGIFKNPDVLGLRDYYSKQLVTIYYITEKYAKDAEVTPQEIAAEYSRLKSRIPPTMLPDLVEASIRKNLEQQKLSRKLPEVVSLLRDKASKEKNLSLLQSR